MRPPRFAAAVLLAAALVLLPPAAPAGQGSLRQLPPAESQGTTLVSTADGVYSLDWQTGPSGLIRYTRWDTGVSAPLCARRGCTHSDGSCPAFVEGDRWLLYGANGRLLLLEQGDGDIRAIWAVAPDGTGRTLLTRCPERENQPLTSLLWEDDTGFWFELMDLTDGTSHIAFLPAGGTELTVSPAQPGRLLQAADGIRYSLDFPQGQMVFQATDLHTGVTTTLCTVSDQWTFLLRDNCLYFCDWQDDCALYTKSLGNTDPPVLRCRLESLGGSSYAWPVEARGSRLVLERAGAQWAVNLDTGARVWVQPAWMQPGTDGPCGAYPQVEEGSYSTTSALVMGYGRSESWYSTGNYGELTRVEGLQMVPCLLDVDAWLQGQVRLTDVTELP